MLENRGMSNYYLLPLAPDEQISFVLLHGQHFTISYSSMLTGLQVSDRVLLIHSARQVVLPYTFKVVSINRPARTTVLEVERAYNTPVIVDANFQKLLTEKNREPGNFSFRNLNIEEYRAIIDRMGGQRMEESELLAYMKRYIAARGYYFNDETLYNYHICLKTRPFVILAGLSGTGKSKLSQLYAEALGHKDRYKRVAVRPNWNDDHYLLGYLNTITGEYVTEPAGEFILTAGNDEDNLYFFCLDEMNLAHVEYYFSQFLSALEEEKVEDRRIELLSKRTMKQLEEQGKKPDIPPELILSANVLFTGTINMDETTQPISDKVIDRANTIEFFAVELDKIPPRQPLPDPIHISATTWQSYKATQPDITYRAHIVEIGKILNKADMGLGYRVLSEIELYLANSKDILEPQIAFDLQVKQRILPRLRGTEAIREELESLLSFTKRNNLPRSEERLDEMKSRLKRDGYTNFWR